MSYEKLCEEVLLLTPHIANAIVEHRDGYRVAERSRKQIVQIDEDKASFGLLRGAQLVEKAKDYRQELGNLHYIIGSFDNLLSLIFPMKDNQSLILAIEPTFTDFKTFTTDVKAIIARHNLSGS